MSANAAVADLPARQNQKLELGQAVIKGRLTAARRPQNSDGWWTHLIVLPAPDAYSSPSTVEVLAKRRLGERDDDVQVTVRLGGYKRSYRATDRETGEQRVVHTADNKLFALED